MPVEVTHPGVYVVEHNSGLSAIQPYPTSIAAFIGRAVSGPLNQPVRITNFGQFQTLFGGLAANFPLSYAVHQFFQNGGSEAVIVRLYRIDKDNAADDMDQHANGNKLSLRAANPGEWGNRLTVSFDRKGITKESAKPFTKLYGYSQDELFNATVTLMGEDGEPAISERFRRLVVTDPADGSQIPNRIDRIFEDQSQLVRVETLGKTPADGFKLNGFGGSDGSYLQPQDFLGDEANRTGIYALDKAAVFNLLCIPPDRRLDPATDQSGQELDPAVRLAAARYCTEKNAFFIVDPPLSWTQKANTNRLEEIDPLDVGITGLSRSGREIRNNCAVYFPNVKVDDPLDRARPALFPPSALIAGAMASMDMLRGVWKAPAGLNANLAGVYALDVDLNDDDQSALNPLGINCLRELPQIGPVIWGARTLAGSNALASEYKYISVRRTALHIEQSVQAGISWAAFEHNDEQLWSSIRLQVNGFMSELARQGAFYDSFVLCDATTNSAADVARGLVNIVIGFAPGRPDEFVTLQIQQPVQPTD